MRVLVAGHQGQLARGLHERSQGAAIELVSLGRPELDLGNETSVIAAVARCRPDVVVNAAAYTAVDRAETEPDLARLINATGAGHVARACAAQGVALIQISTDYVFDGNKGSPYLEDDRTAPINVYGRTKLEGEALVAKACDRSVILRTSWLYSPWGANFVKTMLRLASTQPEIRVVDDQRGSPTYVPDLADTILALARKLVEDPGNSAWGLYHAAGRGESTWYELAGEAMRSAALFDLPVAPLVPIATADYPTPARRPADTRMNCGKLDRFLGHALADGRARVEACVARLATKDD